MQHDKYTYEQVILSCFRNDFHSFPKGKLIKSETPDFILKCSPQKQIGIEISRIFKPVNSTFVFTEGAPVQQEIVRKAQQLFQYNSSHWVYVNVLFKPEIMFTREEVMQYAVRISGAVYQEIKKHPNHFYRTRLLKIEHLEPIDSIFILSHPDMKQSRWQAQNEWLSPGASIDAIEIALKKKEELYRAYQKEKFYPFWLILVSDTLPRRRNFNLRNKLEQITFKSSFKNVIFYELFLGETYQLKTKK